MADRFEQLKLKYQSVLNFIQSNGIQLQNVNMEGDKLFIRATAPSADLKNRVWDQIKLVDPNFSDLTADIQAPAAAAAAAGGASSTPAARTYTVQAGDSLSKISKQFYGDANKYMKIFEANKDKLADPDKIKAGQELDPIIPALRSANCSCTTVFEFNFEGEPAMTWTDQIGNLLKQYTSGGAAAAPAPDVHAHFDQVAEAAPSSALAEGLSAAFKSDQTPAFGQMLSTMFNSSSGEQKAGIINQIMSSVPPGTLTSLLSGAGLASILGGGAGTPRSRPNRLRKFRPKLFSNSRHKHTTRILRSSIASARSTPSTPL